MDHGPGGQFGVQNDRTRGYPIDAGLRRADRVKRGGGLRFPARACAHGSALAKWAIGLTLESPAVSERWPKGVP
jgi:hypothetical protein